MSLLDSKTKMFVSEDENLRETGDWKQFTLYARGKKIESNCKHAPKTCKLVDGFLSAKSCKRGQVKFSVMHPVVHVWPHCGPTNSRLRAHLGLQVPDGAFIRVGNDTKQWIEGRFIVFDDSFEHEVWHNGSDFRLVLIVDFWHPQLTQNQIDNLSAI